jgi:hypothetical protein
MTDNPIRPGIPPAFAVDGDELVFVVCEEAPVLLSTGSGLGKSAFAPHLVSSAPPTEMWNVLGRARKGATS